MKDILLKVQDNEYDFMINLLNKFNFVEDNNSDYFTAEQKQLIEERYDELNSGKVNGVEWKTVEKLLK